MENNLQFTVVIRDRTFILTRSQIEFDSPNYFTSYLLGEPVESQTRRVKLSRDPDLFPVIMDYLCGYAIFPLKPKFILDSSSEDNTVSNLLRDAEFFKLDGLVQACNNVLPTLHESAPSRNRYILLGNRFSFEFFETDFVHRIASAPLESFDTRVNGEKFGRDILDTLITPDKCQGFSGLRSLAAVERLTAFRMAGFRQEDWQLIGWNVSSPTGKLGWPWLDLLIAVEDRKDYTSSLPSHQNIAS